MSESDLPLAGIRVLDLTTLLPGPLAGLALRDAGADVVKIERPGSGDEMRSYVPRIGDTSANYAVLNRGKRTFAADLKDPGDLERVLDLAAMADIVLEQFRPGVAERLGIGYEAVSRRNRAVVYCSISGYGRSGPLAAKAGHDLNYLAESGLLDVVHDSDGRPPLPVTVMADIAGGTYPALVNILLALRRSERTGHGAHLDISMAHNLQILAYGYFATHQGEGRWPVPNRELLTGGSPRYRVYTTGDGRHLAVAALEQKFWDRFTELVGLAPELREDAGREEEVAAALTEIVAGRPAEHWRALFDGEDVCVSVVNTFAEAVEAGLVQTDLPDTITGGPQPVGRLRSIVVDELRGARGALGVTGLDPVPDELWTH